MELKKGQTVGSDFGDFAEVTVLVNGDVISAFRGSSCCYVIHTLKIVELPFLALNEMAIGGNNL